MDSERHVWHSGYCLSASPFRTTYVGRIDADRFAQIQRAFDALPRPPPTACPSGATLEPRIRLATNGMTWMPCKDRDTGALLAPYVSAVALLKDAEQ